jgi:hypothetical protein
MVIVYNSNDEIIPNIDWEFEMVGYIILKFPHITLNGKKKVVI